MLSLQGIYSLTFMKKAVLSDNRLLFLGFSFLMLLSLVFMVFTKKESGFFILNNYHSGWLDDFFILYTNVGDGFFSIAIAVIFFFWRQFLIGVEIITAFLLSGAFVQILKYFFPMPRPNVFLVNAHYHHFILNVTLTGHASFPSGHAASAFALATLLSLFEKNKIRTYWYLLGATLVAYSRIYLGQHFLQDVFAGAIIGFVSGLLVYLIISRYISPPGAGKAGKQMHGQ
jgi:membrane-associated phospholipid phosphatase